MRMDNVISVKVRTRFDVRRKLCKQDIYVLFPDHGSWYLCPHDTMVKIGESIEKTDSWKVKGGYSTPSVSKRHRQMLEKYRLTA